MGIIRILTDRGTEYCGKLETHDYQLYLGINGIEHTKTKARHPQTNGICERFHKTVLHEFYQVAFRRNCITLWKSYRPTWTLGWSITTPKERIKGKCAATERPCRHSLTENCSGWKRSDNSTNRTIGGQQNGADCQIKSGLLHIKTVAYLVISIAFLYTCIP